MICITVELPTGSDIGRVEEALAPFYRECDLQVWEGWWAGGARVTVHADDADEEIEEDYLISIYWRLRDLL